MQQDDETEQRRYWAYYDKLHRCRRSNSVLVQLRKWAWFAWGAWIALSIDTLARGGAADWLLWPGVVAFGVTGWLLWPGAVVLAYTILVMSIMQPDSEDEVIKWLRMVRYPGHVLIPYMEVDRLVREGLLRWVGEDYCEPQDCDWWVLLRDHAHGWKRIEYRLE